MVGAQKKTACTVKQRLVCKLSVHVHVCEGSSLQNNAFTGLCATVCMCARYHSGCMQTYTLQMHT